MSLKLNRDRMVLLIPTYCPDIKFKKYIQELIKIGYKKIIIVNDGSPKLYVNIFNDIKKKKECCVLEHKKNKGKGQALKTGFKYFLKMQKKDEYLGIITLDSDGQHLIKDVDKILKKNERRKRGFNIRQQRF